MINPLFEDVMGEALEEELLNDEQYTLTSMNVYDEIEVHDNCTVQILKNSITGQTSVGWWDNE